MFFYIREVTASSVKKQNIPGFFYACRLTFQAFSSLRTGWVDGVRRQMTGGHKLVEIAHLTLHFFKRQTGEPTQATERGGRGRNGSRVWHRLEALREKMDRF